MQNPNIINTRGSLIFSTKQFLWGFNRNVQYNSWMGYVGLQDLNGLGSSEIQHLANNHVYII